MKIGYSTIDITGPGPYILDGYHRSEACLGVKHPLKAMVMTFEDKKVSCLVALDSIGLTVDQAEDLRQALAKSLRTTYDQVMVCYSHTHSSPKTLDENFESSAYYYYMKDQVVKGSQEALKDSRPYQGAWTYTQGDFGINRREKRQGQVVMGADPQGHLDKRIGLLKLSDPTSQVKDILLLRVSAHGNVLKGDNHYVSSDYFHHTRTYLEDLTGARVMMVNGAAGNINARYRGEDQDLKAMAQAIAYPVLNALEGLDLGPIDRVRVKQEELLALTRPLPTRESIKAMSQEASHAWGVDTSYWEACVYEALDQGARHLTIPYDLQVFMIGQGGFIGCPMEIFSEISDRFNQASPNHLVFLNGYTNGYYMYLASKEERDYGGYEVDWCPIIYGPRFGILMPFCETTEDQLIKSALDLLKGD